MVVELGDVDEWRWADARIVRFCSAAENDAKAMIIADVLEILSRTSTVFESPLRCDDASIERHHSRPQRLWR